MASIQRVLVALLTVLTFTFVYFAQATEAAGKGPRITHKVGTVKSLILSAL
jgi:peptidyl-prolyl cis-trans isomerase B (cyclophilin B)